MELVATYVTFYHTKNAGILATVECYHIYLSTYTCEAVLGT